MKLAVLVIGKQTIPKLVGRNSNKKAETGFVTKCAQTLRTRQCESCDRLLYKHRKDKHDLHVFTELRTLLHRISDLRHV